MAHSGPLDRGEARIAPGRQGALGVAMLLLAAADLAAGRTSRLRQHMADHHPADAVKSVGRALLAQPRRWRRSLDGRCR